MLPSWSLPEFRLGDTFDRLPAPTFNLVIWGKAEEEEEPFRMGPPTQNRGLSKNLRSDRTSHGDQWGRRIVLELG
jgi:hypothetical protein